MSQLTVQLEIVIDVNVTIAQAKEAARELKERILKQCPDIHHVDIHLELTDEHIQQAQLHSTSPETSQVKFPQTTTQAKIHQTATNSINTQTQQTTQA